MSRVQFEVGETLPGIELNPITSIQSIQLMRRQKVQDYQQLLRTACGQWVV